jgi:predicted GH43/DUF377 family glycosyl hydrolase
MISIKREGIVLEKTSLDFENEAVLNPAVIKIDNEVHMFYRAVRKGNFSTIGYCKFDGPLKLIERNKTPLLAPITIAETHGIEDPRIVPMEDKFFLTYTAYDGVNALGSLAITSNLINFERHGIILPQIPYTEFHRLAECSGVISEKYERFHIHNNIISNPNRALLLWDKNLIFFPRKIHNKYYFLHRIRPDIQIASVHELEELTPSYWEQYLLSFHEHILLKSKYPHEVSYIGGGCPPIETKAGWLLIYHGVHDTTAGYVYSACAALLDAENPKKVIARLPYPLLKPELVWELKGEVNNVVFPTGTALFGNTLYIYYGAADKRIACISLSINELLTELLKNPQNENYEN